MWIIVDYSGEEPKIMRHPIGGVEKFHTQYQAYNFGKKWVGDSFVVVELPV